MVPRKRPSSSLFASLSIVLLLCCSLVSASNIHQTLVWGPGASKGDRYGWSVAVEDGGSIVVGAPALSGPGYVSIWKGNHHVGVYAGPPASAQSIDFFGYSVDVGFSLLAVGAPMWASPYGAVFACPFPVQSQQWEFVPPPPASASSSFGAAIRLDHDMLLVGEPLSSAITGPPVAAAGAVHIYQRIPTGPSGTPVWAPLGSLSAPDPAPCGLFGYSIDIDGDTLVIGAPGARGPLRYSPDQIFTNSCPGLTLGAVYVYTRVGNTSWQYSQKLSTNILGDNFGFSVSVYNTTLAVGAPQAVISLYGPAGNGTVYLYSMVNDTFSLWETLQPKTAAQFDQVGFAVALRNNSVLASAPELWSLLDPGREEGSGHVYRWDRNTTETWIEMPSLTSIDGEQGEGFGMSVARVKDGNDAWVVGAPFKNFFEFSAFYGSSYLFTTVSTFRWRSEGIAAVSIGGFGFILLMIVSGVITVLLHRKPPVVHILLND